MKIKTRKQIAIELINSSLESSLRIKIDESLELLNSTSAFQPVGHESTRYFIIEGTQEKGIEFYESKKVSRAKRTRKTKGPKKAKVNKIQSATSKNGKKAKPRR